MKTRKAMLAALTALCVLATTSLLTACGSDSSDEKKVSLTPTQYTFILTIGPSKTFDGRYVQDQQAVIKTVVSAPQLPDIEISQENTVQIIQATVPINSLPYSGTITIRQSLREGYDLSTKPEYEVGLAHNLEVRSMNDEGGVLNNWGKGDGGYHTHTADVLRQLYGAEENERNTKKLNFTISASGSVNIL